MNLSSAARRGILTAVLMTAGLAGPADRAVSAATASVLVHPVITPSVRASARSAAYAVRDPRRYFSALRGGPRDYYAPGVDPDNLVTFRYNLFGIPGRPHEHWVSATILEHLRRKLQSALHQAGASVRASRMTHVKVLNNFYEREDSTGFGYMSWAVIAIWGPHRICGYFRVDPTMWDGSNEADDATCGTLKDARNLTLWGLTGETMGGHQASWIMVPDSVSATQEVYNKALADKDGGRKAVDVPIINNVATAMGGTPRRDQVVRSWRVRSRNGTTVSVHMKAYSG